MERGHKMEIIFKMAGMEGVEPSHTEPESAVLPLDDIPKNGFEKKPNISIRLSKWLGREDSNPRMHGPKPCVLPLDDGPKISIIQNGGEGGIRTLGKVSPTYA
jgi:hypothetical protein